LETTTKLLLRLKSGILQMPEVKTPRLLLFKVSSLYQTLGWKQMIKKPNMCLKVAQLKLE
jgi:hypothetical protein